MYWTTKLGDLLSPPSQPPSRWTFKFENPRWFSESLTSYLDLEFKVTEIQSRPRCLVAAPMVWISKSYNTSFPSYSQTWVSALPTPPTHLLWPRGKTCWTGALGHSCLCVHKRKAKNLNEEEKPPQTVDMSTNTTFTLKKFTIYKLRHNAITLRQEEDGFKQLCWSRVPWASSNQLFPLFLQQWKLQWVYWKTGWILLHLWNRKVIKWKAGFRLLNLQIAKNNV